MPRSNNTLSMVDRYQVKQEIRKIMRDGRERTRDDLQRKLAKNLQSDVSTQMTTCAASGLVAEGALTAEVIKPNYTAYRKAST